MKSFIIPFLFCFLVIMITSCKKDNPVDSSTSVKQIWPLKTGDTWAFHTIEYDTTGAVAQSGSLALVVTTDTIVGGETWYQISGFGTGGPTFSTNESDGLWIMAVSSTGLLPQPFFKYPVSAGDSWMFGGDPVFLQSADTLITVQAGSFHCYEYQLATSDYYYVSPGVGIIEEDSYSSTNSGRLYLQGRLSISSFILK